MPERNLPALVNRLVNRMAGLLIEHLADTDLYEEVSLPLSRYSPGRAKEFEALYNEEKLAGELGYILER